MQKRSMEVIRSLVIDLPLGQTLLLGFWLFKLIVKKLLGAIASFLWQVMLAVTIRRAPECALSNSCSNGDEPEENQEISEGNLIPYFQDRFVADELWPLFSRSPSTLFHLRGVSRHWKHLVDSSVEWRAVNSILSLEDSPRLGASETGDMLVTQRLGVEIDNWLVILGLEYSVAIPSQYDEDLYACNYPYQSEL